MKNFGLAIALILNCKNCHWSLMLRPGLYQLLYFCLQLMPTKRSMLAHFNPSYFAVRGVHLLLGSLHILRLWTYSSFVQVKHLSTLLSNPQLWSMLCYAPNLKCNIHYIWKVFMFPLHSLYLDNCICSLSSATGMVKLCILYSAPNLQNDIHSWKV